MSKVENQLAKAAETKAGELSDALQGTEKALAQTRQQITDVVAKADLPAEILTEINGLMRTSQNAKSTYELLLSRAQDLDTQAAIQIADSRLISPALEPDVPSFPNKRLILALALFAALAIGTALAFLYELFIGGFTSAEQLRSVTGASVAAVIPLTSPGVGSHSVADTIIDRPLSTFSEEIRKLRANVDRFLRTSRQLETRTSGSVIMVTSALPNEGKSTVALTLARAYAVHGYKTLLIDCDLRRPSIHRQLGIEPKTGLVELLRPSKPPVSVAQAITKDLKSPLTVIVGSRPADIATDHLLTDNAFSAIIQSSRKNFDYIIIDTPPIDAVVDGLYVAEHADAVVFAVHWAKTSQRFVTKSIDLLRRYMRDSSEIFMVLNQDSHHKQFAYQYGGYYTE